MITDTFHSRGININCALHSMAIPEMQTNGFNIEERGLHDSCMMLLCLFLDHKF